MGKRLISWAGDGPLNARDEVIYQIVRLIDEAFFELGDKATGKDGGPDLEGCWLNELIAYLRCLNGVLREAGGEHLVADYAAEWRIRILAAFDLFVKKPSDKDKEDRLFIVSVLNDLDGLVSPREDEV